MFGLNTDVYILGATLALIGVLFTALIRVMVARMLNKNAFKINDLIISHEKELGRLRNAHDLRLKEIEKRNAAEEAFFKVRLNLNEENWRRVISQMLVVKDRGVEVIDKLSKICSKGHSLDDADLLDETLVAVKAHREFREAMKPLFGVIRSEDYQKLEAFYLYQGNVVLDIERTQQGRVNSQIRMFEHEKNLTREKRWLENMSAHFLQPRISVFENEAQKRNTENLESGTGPR